MKVFAGVAATLCLVGCVKDGTVSQEIYDQLGPVEYEEFLDWEHATVAASAHVLFEPMPEATEVSRPRLAIIGSSFEDCDNVLFGDGFHGCSYEGAGALIEQKISGTGWVAESRARAGSFQANYFDQWEAIKRTGIYTFAPGQHTKAVVIGLPNDCLLAPGCREAEYLIYKSTLADLIEQIQEEPVESGVIDVSLLVFPDPSVFNPTAFQATFGVEPSDWSTVMPRLNQIFEELSASHNVRLIDAWANMKTMGDGLHPVYSSRRVAVWRILEEVL